MEALADPMQRDLSSVGQLKALLDPFQSVGQPINAFGKLCYFHVSRSKFNLNVRGFSFNRANTVL